MKNNPLHEGYLAARNGEAQTDNPYNVITDIDRYCDWQDGYKDAQVDMIGEEFMNARVARFKDILVDCCYWLAFLSVCSIIGLLIYYSFR